MLNTGMAQYSKSASAQQRLTTDPAQAQRLIQSTNDWVNWVHDHPPVSTVVSSGNGPSAVFQIPVVFHVILPGSLAANPQGTIYDPTDAQIMSTLAYLNQTFAATYSGYVDTNNGGTYIPIQFVLAQRTSLCNATSGIERIDGSSVANYSLSGVNNGSGTGASELAVKNLSRWPVNQYYNIYIVNKIDGKDGTAAGVAFTTGFAYQAPADPTLDGYVILASQVAPGTVNIPHEIAHALSVYNTFQGGSVTTCPANSNCLTDGDQVCDTPPELQSNFNCPSGTNPCTGLPYTADLGGNNVQNNFMDYSSCQNRFTPGQRARMIFGLLTYHGGWLASTGNLAPGTSPVAACTPSSSNPSNTNDAGVYEVKISDLAVNGYASNTTTIAGVPYTTYNTTSYLDYSSGGYNTDGNKAYVDHTCGEQANLSAGTSYKFYVKAGPTASGENVVAYIDYNNNGTFEPSELVFSHNGTVANEYDSAVVAIPTTLSFPGLVTCIPLRMRVISDPGNLAINPCGPLAFGQAEDYSVVIKGAGSANGTVTISLPAQADSSCVNTALTFTASPSVGVDTNTASYKWFVNGIATGTTGKTYTTSTIADGATVTAKLYFISQCGTADSSTSNAIGVHRFTTLAPRVTIALTAGNNPGCPGTSLTFTATPYNGGTASYQWKVNGANVGTNSNTYTSSALVAGQVVSCVMYSSSSCAFPLSAVSNSVTIMSYYLTASLTITATPNPSCAGGQVVLQASSLNQSANSLFQWYVNGTPVAGATASTYASSSFQNTDIVRCVMISPSACIVNHSDTSNPIVISTSPTLVPQIFDSIQSGSNPGCLDSTIVFAGYVTKYTITNYEWLVNGVPTYNGMPFSTDSLLNGDRIILRANVVRPNDNGCYTSDTIYTLPITVTLGLTPDPPVLSLSNSGQLVANTAGTYEWYGPNGLIPGVTGQTYTPPTSGYYHITRIDTACSSKSSNVLYVNTHVGVASYTIQHVKVYPNPTTGLVNIVWGTNNTDMKVAVYNAVGQGIYYTEAVNQSEKTIDLSYFPAGTYFVVLRDNEGKSSTTPITLTN